MIIVLLFLQHLGGLIHKVIVYHTFGEGTLYLEAEEIGDFILVGEVEETDGP